MAMEVGVVTRRGDRATGDVGGGHGDGGGGAESGASKDGGARKHAAGAGHGKRARGVV